MKQIARMMFSPCPECGCLHNMPICPDCLRREIEQARAKRVVMVQHASGAVEVAPDFGLSADETKRIAEDAVLNQPPIEY